MSGKGITVDLLTSLRASSAQTAGTENGSALTNGPLRKCKAVLTITVLTGSIAAHLEQSSDNATFYKVPGSDFKDASTGANPAAVGQHEVLVDLTGRYVRVTGVVTTGPITWRCDLAVID